MHSLPMLLQSDPLREPLITDAANVWAFTGVYSEVFLQVALGREHLLADVAGYCLVVETLVEVQLLVVAELFAACLVG